MAQWQAVFKTAGPLVQEQRTSSSDSNFQYSSFLSDPVSGRSSILSSSFPPKHPTGRPIGIPDQAATASGNTTPLFKNLPKSFSTAVPGCPCGPWSCESAQCQTDDPSRSLLRVVMEDPSPDSQTKSNDLNRVRRSRPRLPTILGQPLHSSTTASLRMLESTGHMVVHDRTTADPVSAPTVMDSFDQPYESVHLTVSSMQQSTWEDDSLAFAHQAMTCSGEVVRKRRQAKRGLTVEKQPTINEESTEDETSSRPNGRSDAEDRSDTTGYYSQASDVVSQTASSFYSFCSDLTPDGEQDATTSAVSSRLLDEKSVDGNRSFSDPTPGGRKDQLILQEVIMQIDASSSRSSASEPNLSAAAERLTCRRNHSSTGTMAVTASESPKTPQHTICRSSGEYSSNSSLTDVLYDEQQLTRRHVMQSLFDAERSYVTNLRHLVSLYYNTLRSPEYGLIVDAEKVDEIFFQMTEIKAGHETFFDILCKRLENWQERSTIGDVFLSLFTSGCLNDAYIRFVNHYQQSRSTIKHLLDTKPAFSKFFEVSNREHPERLNLYDLLIMPVQRIPRYEMILRDLLKHTPRDHPDIHLLEKAFIEIKSLADILNQSRALSVAASPSEKDSERLRMLEDSTEGLSSLLGVSGCFIRQDLVAELKGGAMRKDCCLILFSDLLVFAVAKKKCTGLRRGSMGLFSSQQSSGDTANKFKVVWHHHLSEVEVFRGSPSAQTTRVNHDRLEEDLKTIAAIRTLVDSLSIQHKVLESSVIETQATLQRVLSEKQQGRLIDPTLERIELHVISGSSIERFIFSFLSCEIRSSWESHFEEARLKLASLRLLSTPEFVSMHTITKTRSGMQFVCNTACPWRASGQNTSEARLFDAWACSSDGYVGQSVLLSSCPELQTMSTFVVAYARISCMALVPGADLRTPSDLSSGSPHACGSSRMSPGSFLIDSRTSSVCSAQEDDDCPISVSPSGHTRSRYTIGPDPSSVFSSTTTDDLDLGVDYDMGPLATAGTPLFNYDSPCSSPAKSSNSLLSSQTWNGLAATGSSDVFQFCKAPQNQWMWLGAYDGCLYIYPIMEGLHMIRQKIKVFIGTPVSSIALCDARVYIGLSSGDVKIVSQDTSGVWDLTCPATLAVSSSPVTHIVRVQEEVWCSSGSTIFVIKSLQVERSFRTCTDSSINRMVAQDSSVWVCFQSGPRLALYHASLYTLLLEIDITSSVTIMLGGLDAIIRQHKQACLRITSMLVCRTSLWVGTSAGVVLVYPLPEVTSTTQDVAASLVPVALQHGHSGHVRFLTVLELSASEAQQVLQRSSLLKTPKSSKKKSGQGSSEASKSSSMSEPTAANVTFVLSGGDGFEDFKSPPSGDFLGRDDSLNHVLMWKA